MFYLYDILKSDDLFLSIFGIPIYLLCSRLLSDLYIYIYAMAIFTGIGYNYVCQFSLTLTLSHQVSVVKLSD